MSAAKTVDWDALGAVLSDWFRHKQEAEESGARLAERIKSHEDAGLPFHDAALAACRDAEAEGWYESAAS